MDLAFPRFAGLGDGPRQFHAPWTTSSDSPASPATSRLDTSGEEDRAGLLSSATRRPDTSGEEDRTGLLSSPCLDLDELSSSPTTIGLSDLSVTLLCGSNEVFSPVNSDQVLSDVDFPPEPVALDTRQVVCRRDASPDVPLVDPSGKRMPGEVSMTVSPVPPLLDTTVTCASGVVRCPRNPRWSLLFWQSTVHTEYGQCYQS